MSKNSERLRHLYKGKKYRALQKRVFLRDGHKCVKCGATLDLTLDHIIPRTQDESLFWDEDNCRTLCDACRVKNDLDMISNGELPRPARTILVKGEGSQLLRQKGGTEASAF